MATKLNPLLKPIIVSVAANDDVRTLAGGLVKTTGGGWRIATI